MKEKKERKARVNQKEIDLVKALVEAGVKRSKIIEISGRSGYSIDQIEKCDGTLKDYHRIVFDHYKERLAQKTTSKDQVVLESASTDQEAEYPVSENKINENDIHLWNSLEIISKRLDHIETMMSEHIDSHQAELTLLKSKKIIW